jgi:CheY-like chemotaxis protein
MCQKASFPAAFMTQSVLIVEDDDIIRENLKDLLEMESYPVGLARHGREALNLLLARFEAKQPLPFVILLDLNMPVMAGREFLTEFNRLPAPVSNIPVLVMTAVPNAGKLEAAGILKKPIELDELLSRIQAFKPRA